MPPSPPVHPRHPSPGDGWSHRCGDAPSAPRPGGSPAPPAAPGCPPGVALPPPSPLPPLAAAPTSIPRPPSPRSVSPRPGSEPGAGAPPAAPAAAKAGHGAAPRGVMATRGGGGHLLPRDPGKKGPRTPQFPESAASYSSAASQERADALRHPESEMATSWVSHFHQHGATFCPIFYHLPIPWKGSFSHGSHRPSSPHKAPIPPIPPPHFCRGSPGPARSGPLPQAHRKRKVFQLPTMGMTGG